MLITGATGFVGGHLVDHCLTCGDELHALTLPEGDRPLPPEVTTHPRPLLEPDAITALVAEVDPDVVIHLAGEASVGGSFAHPQRTWQVNTWGTLSVLEALRRTESVARALIVTSGEIYGRVPVDRLPVGAATPLRPLSPYAASKAAADLMAGQYAENYGLDVIRLRPFNQIGPRQDPRFVVPSVAKQIAEAEAEGESELVITVGNVTTRRDFTDVRDTARAYRLIAERARSGAIHHPCTGRSLAVSEIIDALVGQARIPATVASDSAIRREGEQPDLYGDPSPLAEQLGWQPEIELEDTVRDTLDWWRGEVRRTR
jgi:GDP-4-dehydro-6-deoxy-D-mannose reductase